MKELECKFEFLRLAELNGTKFEIDNIIQKPDLKNFFKSKLCGKDNDKTFLRMNESCVYFTNEKKYLKIEDAENECRNKLNFSRLFFIKNKNELTFYRAFIKKIQTHIEKRNRYYLIGLKYEGLFLILYLNFEIAC